MSKTIFAFIFVTNFFSIAIATSTTPISSKMTVTNARVRFLPSTTTGAFLEISNSDSQVHSITKATFSGAGKVELHTHMMDKNNGHEMHGKGHHGGMMKMVQVEKIEIPAKGKQELKPGSFHIMLIDLKKPLNEGETVNLDLFFEDGSSLTVIAPVQKF